MNLADLHMQPPTQGAHVPRLPWVHTHCITSASCMWDVNSSPQEEEAEAPLTTLFSASREPSLHKNTGKLPGVPSSSPPTSPPNTYQVAKGVSLLGSPFAAYEGAIPQASPKTKYGTRSPGSSRPGIPFPLPLLPGGLAKSFSALPAQQGQGPASVKGGESPKFSAYLLVWQNLCRLSPHPMARPLASLGNSC